MAVMNDADRKTAARALARQIFGPEITANLDLDEIASMVSGLDDWVDANLAAINSAIPADVRAKASLQQKASALAYVAMKRGGII